MINVLAREAKESERNGLDCGVYTHTSAQLEAAGWDKTEENLKQSNGPTEWTTENVKKSTP